MLELTRCPLFELLVSHKNIKDDMDIKTLLHGLILKQVTTDLVVVGPPKTKHWGLAFLLLGLHIRESLES